MATQHTIANFIPLNRKVFKHAFWLQKRSYSRFEAWLDLLATARFDNSETSMLISGKVVRWNRGELVASLRYLGERWGWSTTKVNNFLKLLTAEEMLKTRTAEETAQTIISICNYEHYNPISKKEKHQQKQADNSEVTAKKQADNKTNTDNKVQTNKKIEIYRGFAHLTLYTHQYFELIDMGYTQPQINDVLDAIENFTNNKKYASLFLTAKKWLARDFDSGSKASGSSRVAGIASAFELALRS